MRLAAGKIRSLASRQSRSLSAVLRDAGVSRTAFYSLARRPSLLPRTVHALAEGLGVNPRALLESSDPPAKTVLEKRQDRARAIIAAHAACSFENVWHTLVLLDMPPAERLNRSLIRGRAITVHQ